MNPKTCEEKDGQYMNDKYAISDLSYSEKEQTDNSSLWMAQEHYLPLFQQRRRDT